MAINTIELVKNKNYGFQLTAPDLFVDILTLDLVSGVCTSSYFDSPELAQFRRAALELFTIVAPAERAAGALNMMNRLVAVAAADDATVTRSVNIAGNLATLRIAVDVNPGSFVAHVPFSGDGAIAWAGGNDSGGGGGGVTAVNGTFPITSTGGATPDIGVTLDTVTTDSLEVLPSGLAVHFDPDAGLQSTVGNGLQIKPGLTQGIAFNVGGEVVVQADPNYFDFSFAPGALTPLNSGVVAGTYGDAANVAQVQVDAKGRVLSVVNVPISGGGTVTAVTGTAPILSSGGATPDISLSPGTSSGDLLTWNGVAWVAAAPPAGVSAFLLNDVFVSQNGSDVTGDGSATKPFATVGAAMASITLAASNNRYAIRLAAGDYSEPAPLALKPDVFIVGEGWENTLLDAAIVLDPSFSTAIDPFSGLYNLAVQQTVTVDTAAVTNNTARFNAVNTRFNDDLTITAFSDSNIFGIVRSVTGGGVTATFNGGDTFSFGTLYQGPVNVGESVAAKTFFTSNADTFNGPLTATNAGGTPAGDFIVVILGSSLGYEVGNPNSQETATFNGDVILRTTSNFVPEAAKLVLAGGATMEQWSFATGVGYEPTTPGDWLTPPTEVSGALDELASRISTGGTVTAVTATAPLLSSGGATPDISLTAGTSSGDVLTWNGAAWTSAAPTGGLVNWTENTTTYAGHVINDFTVANAAPHVDAALVAKGTGATVAQIADGTAVGGMNRGDYATDWQKSRGGNGQVASGNFSTISGGANNVAGGQYASITGGYLNNAAGEGAVAGGVNNSALADRSVALGQANIIQNTAPYSAAIGINNFLQNSAVLALGSGTQATANSAMAVGVGVTASAQNATAVSGGGGTASGNWASVLGGFANTASGTGSVAAGGQNLTASGDWSGALSGYGNVAASAYEAVLGYYAYNFAGTANSFVSTDVALGYGNGTGTGVSSSNAFTFLKNGWLAIARGQAKPQDALDVNGNARMTGAVVQDGFTSGAAISIGEVCYLAADGKVYPAQSNNTTTSTVVGIAVEAVGAADLEIALATFNKTGGFAGLTTGTEYFLSATAAGAVVDYTTLSATSGAQIVSLGYARSATEIQLNIQRRGVTP